MLSCSSTQKLVDNNFRPSKENLSQTINQLPNYSDDLQSVEGKGRAIVSEPGNTERVTIRFASNQQKSLVTIRNGLGIEGGQLLTDGDTLLIYNKVDKYARKVPVQGANLNRINRLASLNILDMLNYSVKEEDVDQFLENESFYQLQLKTGTKVYIDKNSLIVRQIIQPSSTSLPYSKIEYEAYTSMKGFTLPRKISIFGPDGKSKIALQLTALELNPKLDPLTIELPDDIPIYHE
ncbi:DUF4292 domain-containing protein [Fodinibius sp.]|uniref:DUF4292 domain-containing protein n=1 Tax=Fodinibius sp. TaxID=1872440 RepID=UPI002ACE6562|nr:DUF4292 domain-containing protein [Fodinibius sp.]